MADSLGKQLLQIVLPKLKRGNGQGTSFSNTFDPSSSGQTLTVPGYRDHQVDIFTTRAQLDARDLLENLFRNDPDVSATLNAYLTVANTDPRITVYDQSGQPDRPGQKLAEQIIEKITTRTDYSTGFEITNSLKAICENMRYMALLRGAIGAELIFDKLLVPSAIRQVDMATITWLEDLPNIYKPQQQPKKSQDTIKLDVPTFFTSWYRKSPTDIYAYSPWISAINTVAARQQVINDLYRIMQVTGYPRIDIKIMEDILRKNAPPSIATNENAMKAWLEQRLTDIAGRVANLRPDQAWAHFDSAEAKILNDGGPSRSMDVSAVIEVLNGMNQAALKTMSTIIGRGESGVNTASVEALIFMMSATELNVPVADMLSQMLTMAIRLQGSTSRVEVTFEPAELRPQTELEPMMVVKQARNLELLSYGIFSDDEFHLEMFGRFRPDAAPELSGTRFLSPSKTPQVDTSSISPNSDPTGRSLSPDGNGTAKSKQIKKPTKKG